MVETKKLEVTAKSLNKQSDDLNETLQKIQDKLNSYNIGLEVWDSSALVSREEALSQDEDDSFIAPFKDATTKAIELYLGYAKLSDGWGLAIQEREVYYAPDYRSNQYEAMDVVGSYNLQEPQPLLKASRGIRIKSLERLQYLVDAIQRKAETSIDAIKKARQLADEL